MKFHWRKEQAIRCEEVHRRLNWNWLCVFYGERFVERPVDVELTFDSSWEWIRPMDQSVMNHSDDYSIVSHSENFSKRKRVRLINKINNSWPVSSRNGDWEVYDFVCEKRLLIHHLPWDKYYIHSFLHHWNSNWYYTNSLKHNERESLPSYSDVVKAFPVDRVVRCETL